LAQIGQQLLFDKKHKAEILRGAPQTLIPMLH